MSANTEQRRCERAELISLYVLRALPASEISLVEEHLASCPECRQHLESLYPVAGLMRSWPEDILRPPGSTWNRLQERLGEEASEDSVLPEVLAWREREWEDVAPGISCKLLATDTERDRVSMWYEREHQRFAAPVLPKGNGSERTQTDGSCCRCIRAQHQASQDTRLAHAREALNEVLCSTNQDR
jgi:anti-sigma factor RsiW